MPSTRRVHRSSMLMEDDNGTTYRVYRDVVFTRIESLDGDGEWEPGLADLSTDNSRVNKRADGSYEIVRTGTRIRPCPGQEWH
jgi:hypothetical protein